MRIKHVIRTKAQMREFLRQIKGSGGQVQTSDGRRASWRLSHSAPGSIEISEQPENSEPIYVMTRDISAEGLGFLSHQNLEEDQELFLTIETDGGELEVPGTVIHSTVTVGGYKIGVKFIFEDR